MNQMETYSDTNWSERDNQPRTRREGRTDHGRQPRHRRRYREGTGGPGRGYIYQLPLRLHTGSIAPVDALLNAPGEARYYASQALTADGVVDEIRSNGGQAEAWEMDLSDNSNTPRLFDRAEAAFDQVDILINNAAHCVADSFLPPTLIGESARAVDGLPITSVTSESIDRHFAVNVRAAALLSRNTPSVTWRAPEIGGGSSA